MQYAHARYNNEALRLYEVLDNRLRESAWLGGDEYSIADIATYPWTKGHKGRGVDETSQPNPSAPYAASQRPRTFWQSRAGTTMLPTPVVSMQAVARRLLGVIVITAAIQATAAQGTLEDGLASYRSGDYVKAVQVWRPLAEKGDAVAQYRLGALYADGKGVARDDATAMMWFQRSANQGNADAQYNVGASYAEGLGVTKDDGEAAKWFRRAADQGMPYAQINLGLLYASGHGVPKNNVEAMKWLGLAVYALPPGGPRSDAARAMQDVADKMNSEEVQEAREQTRRWKATPEAK